jgi:hypothetical protein
MHVAGGQRRWHRRTRGMPVRGHVSDRARHVRDKTLAIASR